eukprot:g45405.t1
MGPVAFPKPPHPVTNATPSPSPKLCQVFTISPDLPLTKDEWSVLSKGLAFIPLHPHVNEFRSRLDVEHFFFRLRAYFFNNLFISNCCRNIDRLNLSAPLPHSNLSPTERAALCSLCSNPNLTIKPADKGGAIVVWRNSVKEQSLFRCYTGTIPHPFLRNIEDCIGAASYFHEELEQFINFTKTFHPNLKFTWTISSSFLFFLDLSVSISGDRTKQTFHITQRFTCTSIDMVYYIRSSRCGLLYIGETKRRLRDHFVEHLRSVRDKRQHLPVANHFNSPSHSLGDIMGLLQCHNDTTCKLEEQHLIIRLGSLQPNVLNVDFTSFKISPPRPHPMTNPPSL